MTYKCRILQNGPAITGTIGIYTWDLIFLMRSAEEYSTTDIANVCTPQNRGHTYYYYYRA